MAQIRGYMGVSVDGYIASPDGSIDWLRKYDSVDFGEHSFERFFGEIGTVVMGRTTYDAIVGFGEGWSYAGRRAIIVTSRPLADPLGPLETWGESVDALVTTLRAIEGKDVWIIGGGLLQQAMIARGALDRLELFVVPEIVGEGIAAFPPNGFARSISLAKAESLDAGVAWLDYRFG